MPAAHTLLLFTAAVLGLMLSPGPNMAFVLSQSLARGTRAGIAVAGGILAADVLMTVLTALGVTTVVSAWPPSFDLLRYGGAAYLAWLAVRAWLERRSPAAVVADTRSLRHVFVRAVLVSLLNPKALLFFLLFLPAFVEPARGPVAAQLLCLGVVMSAVAFVFHALLALSGAQCAKGLGPNTASLQCLQRLQSAVFLGLAIRLFTFDATGAR
jgi:threonine/homoserine/homoserine lactone efflux protein